MVTQRDTKEFVIHLRLDSKMVQQIDKQAKVERRSQRAEMIRVLLERALAAKEGMLTA
jgi:metal-responsive CopG/Arc/MetJ family transcriptional regulator